MEVCRVVPHCLSISNTLMQCRSQWSTQTVDKGLRDSQAGNMDEIVNDESKMDCVAMACITQRALADCFSQGGRGGAPPPIIRFPIASGATTCVSCPSRAAR